MVDLGRVSAQRLRLLLAQRGVGLLAATSVGAPALPVFAAVGVLGGLAFLGIRSVFRR